MNRLNSTIPTTSAASGMTKASARLAIHSSTARYPLASRMVRTSGLLTVSAIFPSLLGSRLKRASRPCSDACRYPNPKTAAHFWATRKASGRRADDALDEIIHAFELDGGLD